MFEPSNKVENPELLTVEELERLIQQEMSSEGTADVEYLQKLTEAVRRKQHYPTIDAHQALDMFKSIYLSERENTESEAKVQSHNKKKHRKYVRVLWAAAIMVLLLCTLIVVAQAANINIFNIFGFWTDEKFYFGKQYMQDSNQQVVELPELPKGHEFSSLQEAFAVLKIQDKLLPTWQPEGYELLDLKISDVIPGQLQFESFYQSGDRNYAIDITLYSDIASVGNGFYEKDDTPMELCSLPGHTAYVFSNLDYHVVTWMDGHYNISISGNLETETLIQIAESIYE